MRAHFPEQRLVIEPIVPLDKPFSMGPYFISSFINLLLAINGKVYAKALVYEKMTTDTEFSKNNRKFQRN